jgi:hypothetical protein
MRIIIDSVLDGVQVRAAIEALDNARIPHEGGAQVKDRDTEYAVILVQSAFVRNAVAVLRNAGIRARPQ